MTLIVFTAFVNVCTRQSVSYKAFVTSALIRAHGIHAVCIQAADVVGTFIDIHTALPVALKASAARATVATGQIFAAFVAKRGGAHIRSL